MATPPVVSVCKAKAPASLTEAIEFDLEQWSSLPSNHVVGATLQGLTYSEDMRAVGGKWRIVVAPGGWSSSSDAEEEVQRRKEHVAIFLYYRGDSEALRTKCSFSLEPAAGQGGPDARFFADLRPGHYERFL